MTTILFCQPCSLHDRATVVVDALGDFDTTQPCQYHGTRPDQCKRVEWARELPPRGERVRVRHRGRLMRGVFVIEGYDEVTGSVPGVWLRHERRAAGHLYRLADCKFIRPGRRP